MILHGDCVTEMAAMPEASVDAIVCDPPYGLTFMGKHWDELRHVPAHTGPQWGGYGWHGGPPTPGHQMQEWHQRWATEALRVAKPGAYLLAFGGTRTYHRLACAIEDAGWIIRDTLVWAYAQGFPKSRALLKPAWEPIVMARKPGPLRELAIDACRIGMTDEDKADVSARINTPNSHRLVGNDLNVANYTGKPRPEFVPAGRWPANVILTDPIFDGGVEGVVGGGETAVKGEYRDTETTVPDAASPFFGRHDYRNDNRYANDSGTYSRFFLIPKADRAEREPVFGGLEATDRRTLGGGLTGVSGDRSGRGGAQTPLEMGAAKRRNHHPTVKPLDLMRHLVRLVTPIGGTVLDPFLGSGTTAIAAEMEGFAWIGIEREAEYVAIAEARLQGVQRGLGLSA